MQHNMQLTAEQEAILEGVHGDTLARVMETLVRYGEIFGATKMVPVTSAYNHLVTSFGLKALTPVYELMNQLIRAGLVIGLSVLNVTVDILVDKLHLNISDSSIDIVHGIFVSYFGDIIVKPAFVL